MCQKTKTESHRISTRLRSSGHCTRRIPIGIRSVYFTALAIGILLGPGASQAAEFIVDRVDDDATVSQCDPGINLDCTLRGAIIAANLTPGAPHTVTLPAGTFSLTVTGDSEDSTLTGDLDITADMVIQGAGELATVIDGGGSAGLGDRVFEVIAGETHMVDLTVREGFSPSAGAGGLVRFEGALTLERVTVADNECTGFAGGGIASNGLVTIVDSTIRDNFAISTGGGIATTNALIMTGTQVLRNQVAEYGGGLAQLDGPATITESVFIDNVVTAGPGGAIKVGENVFGASASLTGCFFENNRALGVAVAKGVGGLTGGLGGAIFMDKGVLDVSTCAFFNNEAELDGGAINVGNGDPSNQVTIEDSEFGGNQASNRGGGIHWDAPLGSVNDSTFTGNQAEFGGGLAVATNGEITVTNSTFSGNMATTDFGSPSGGGIHNRGDLTLDSCTLVGNSAAFAPAIDPGFQLDLTNNIIEGGCGLGGEESPLGGPLSHGGNIESPGASCGLSGAIDTLNVPDLEMGPLANFGGPTPTHLPYPTSPVVGAGKDDLCLATDQRGEPHDDGDCDSGAVERQLDDLDDPATILAIFIGDFETGDTSQWSQTVP